MKRHLTRRSRQLCQAHQAGEMSFAELDAVVGGFVAHVQHAESEGLLEHLLGPWPPPGVS